jgi:hypothetical protein
MGTKKQKDCIGVGHPSGTLRVYKATIQEVVVVTKEVWMEGVSPTDARVNIQKGRSMDENVLDETIAHRQILIAPKVDH